MRLQFNNAHIGQSLRNLATKKLWTLTEEDSTATLDIPDDVLTLSGGYPFHHGQCNLTFIQWDDGSALIDYTIEAGENRVTVRTGEAIESELFSHFSLYNWNEQGLPEPISNTGRLQQLAMEQIISQHGPIEALVEAARRHNRCDVLGCEEPRAYFVLIEGYEQAPRLRDYGSHPRKVRCFVCASHNQIPQITSSSPLK